LKERLDDLTLVLKRKAGPDGQLFGGVGAKMIVEELTKMLGDEFLNNKGVKIVSIVNLDGEAIKGDIKHTGQFGASMSLTKEISASYTIVVDADT
jgi:ribosomal protein L9